MSFETQVLVDRVYVTKRVRLEDILKRNEKKSREETEVKEVRHAPQYGVLTRTVLPSPAFNWIVPARIRHGEKNDVVFVGVGLPFSTANIGPR